MKPFIKWVGGKRQLSDIIVKKLKEVLTSESTYYEPFLGGGAILLQLNPKQWVAGDANPFLINLWNNVINNCDELLENITAIADAYNELSDTEEQTEFYMIRRMEFNIHCHDSIYESALFIFLNHTCFNGLWRVNSKNGFNVPHNKTKKYPVIDIENYIEISKSLSHDLLNASFEQTLETCKKGDVVYIDPPYIPISKTSFTSYTKEKFSLENQKELSDLFDKLSKKGVFVLLSNSNTPEVHELYKKYNISEIKATRSINRTATKRGATLCEVVVSSW